MDLNQHIKQLKNSGERLTAVRHALIEILSHSHKPLSVQELLKSLSKKKITVNKTTVYRQLAAMMRSYIIEEVRLTDRSVRYELAESRHHHHLVCLKCHKIEDVSFDEDFKRQEKIIKKKTGFTITQHSLEFFGMCAVCQKKYAKK